MHRKMCSRQRSVKTPRHRRSATRYLTHVATDDWPIELTAVITDNYTVASAWVEFVVENPDGTRRPSQTFVMHPTQTQHVGRFPDINLPVKSRVHYRIWAEDAAIPGEHLVSSGW